MLHLAKLYDYVVREFDPRLVAQGSRRAGGGGSRRAAERAAERTRRDGGGRGGGRGARGERAAAAAAAALPRCVADSRALRRAIERHEHFDEVFHWWQHHHWTGDGYAAWPTLPAEPVENAFVV